MLSRLHYVINPRFGREQRAVLSGRIAHDQWVAVPQSSNSALRRNIHRLEKGLLMRPRARSFAADYIGDTVAAFRFAVAGGACDKDELKWACDVLGEYFAVVVDTPPIAAARLAFSGISLPPEASIGGQAWVPRPRSAGVSSGVGYADFLALCRQRRSVRWFTPKKVPRDLIDQALLAAREAPSACNRQPFYFRLFEGADAARIASMAMGTVGYAEQIPLLLVLLGDFSAFSYERDRHLPYIDGSLAAMQLMLALETLGLASCPINWPDVEVLERRMDEALRLAPWVRPIMLIAVGYPDPEGGVAHSAKKSLSLLRKDDGR